MASVFSRILQGEIPSQKILETDRFFAFLDIRPIARGHTLVIPKAEVDSLYDLSPEDLKGILPFAARIAKAIRIAIPCQRVGMMVAGFEVPHAHIHLVPLQQERDLDFAQARPATPTELSAVADLIRKALT